jgi:negative regulator of sigma E activity
MSRIIDEQLSALLDGELPVEQEALLLRRLESEPELREKLARFGLIGELVRDTSVQTSATPISALAISGRISATIAAQETPGQSAVPSLSPSSAGTGFVGAGIAALIALVAMFNLADIGNVTQNPGAAQVAHDDGVEMAVDSVRLTRYLVSHAQYSNSASRQLVNSHIAMAAVTPAVWTSHE